MSLTTATAAAAVARGDSGAHGCLLSRDLQPPPQQLHIRAIDELQDGDTSSLEPGEVVTPPHLNHDDAAMSPAQKKVPAKDAKSKTLRKLAQIDTDGGKVRALLEQRDVGSRRKERTSSTPRALENGTTRAPSEDPDDSEGLYSDTDSSGEEQRNVEDVQQARKEKQAEAAAAAMPQAAPPVGPPFIGHNPLRFHMRPPFCEFPRMGFLPRMPRGGLRMRPPFFNRPPSRMGAPNMSGAPPSGSYGPALPPSAQGPSGSSTVSGKQLKSDLDWTTTEPPIQFNFNLVSDCTIAQHKACQEKAETTAKKPQHTLKSKEPASDALSKGKHQEKAANEKNGEQSKEKNGESTKERNRKSSRDKQREKSKEKHGDRSKEKSRDKSKEKSRDKSKEKLRDKSKEKSRDKVKEKSRDVSMEGRRERSKERHKERTKERTRERSKDKLRERSKEKPRDMPKELTRGISNDRHREISKDRHRAKSKETKPNEMPLAKSKDDKNDVRRPKESSRDVHTNHAERSRDISKDNHRDRDPKEPRSRDGKREQSAERQREAFKDNRPRPRSREKSTAKCSKESSKDDKSRERAGEKLSGSEKEKPSVSSKEKPSVSSKEKEKPPRDKKHERTKTRSRSRNHSPESEDRTPPLTPPRDFLLPPAAATSDVDASDLDEKPRGLDIFAESPPRLHTATQLATVPQRSTTPPLIVAPVTASNKAAPLLKASEIHSRIGALLEDNDLHLEALLATKEQLLRRTNEHKERKEAPKMEIKAEMQQQQAPLNSDWESADLNQVVPRRINPFRKQESVLKERKSTSQAASSLGNGGNAWPYRSQSRERQRSEEYKEVSIKIERNISPTPLPMPMIDVSRIKLERNVTPPLDTEREVLVRNGAVAANAPPPTATVAAEQQESPDTDDYIDNWENDDSLSSMPKTAAAATAPPSAAVRPLTSSIDEATISGDSNEDDTNDLWNAKSTPPPKAKQRQSAIPLDGGANQEHLVNIYDKFMNSINMSSEEGQTAASKNSSLSNSTAETETSSGSESESTSSSSSDDDEEESSTTDDDEEEGEEEEDDAVQKEEEVEQLSAETALIEEDPPEKEQQQQLQLQQKKNNVSKDLRKLKSLEDNLARIQMMRENYDSGDEISEELLKMESLFLMQRNAIMDKYRKQELKSQQEVQQKQEPRSPTPVNSIFDDNREAIKLTLSPLKLTRKPAIFDNDETEHPQQQQQQQHAVKVKLEEGLRPQIGTNVRRPKEIAIVKPTIVETRNRPRIPRSTTGRERTRSRSHSRNRERFFRRSSVRPNRVKDSSRSPSPRPRWRPPSPRRGIRLAKKPTIKRSHSKSVSRSRTRSRSPKRSRKRFQKLGASRRRVSVSPGPVKPLRPRSPKVHRRRSYSRERERSPLPFRPPSPPMRRSWSSSHSHSRSPTRRRSHSRTRSNSISRSRSPFDGRREEREFADYFGEDQSLEAAAYYYNMSLLHGETTGEDYDTYAAYIDSAYRMEQAYAQLSEAMDIPAGVYGEYGALMETSPVLRELPKAHTPDAELLDTKPIKLEPEEIKDVASVVPAAMSVAVRKGNVLEIVPTNNESEAEDRKPKKRVSFVDSVKPNYESDGEDRVIVSRVVERAMQQYQQRRAEAAARLQRLRDELLAAPPPPPPVTPMPPDQEKAVLVQKKSKMRYFHLDPLKREIVMSHSRVMRAPVPRFDRKHFEMLVKTGRLPPLPHGFLRHRPPLLPPNADAATKAAMLKEYFSKHPPPTPRMQLRMPMRLPMGISLPGPMRMPMGMPMRTPLMMHEGGMPMPMHNGVPYFLSGPPPSSPPVSMPIPVLGAHPYHTYPQPAPMMPAPSPGLLPIPVLPVPDVIASATPSPVPFFTPPPLPTFTVQPVPTIREIMPVDILQKIGPLPKTLDLDGGSTPRADEVKLEIKEEPLGEEQLLVESQ